MDLTVDMSSVAGQALRLFHFQLPGLYFLTICSMLFRTPYRFLLNGDVLDSRSSLMSSFSLHKANDRLVHSLQSPRSLRSPNQPQYQSRVSGSATSTYAEQKQPQKYAVLPPISAYSAQTQPAYSGTPSNTQRVHSRYLRVSRISSVFSSCEWILVIIKLCVMGLQICMLPPPT